jgi:hypothetical protein
MARSIKAARIIGVEVGFVGSLFLLQTVSIDSSVSQILVLVAVTFLGYSASDLLLNRRAP